MVLEGIKFAIAILCLRVGAILKMSPKMHYLIFLSWCTQPFFKKDPVFWDEVCERLADKFDETGLKKITFRPWSTINVPNQGFWLFHTSYTLLEYIKWILIPEFKHLILCKFVKSFLLRYEKVLVFIFHVRRKKKTVCYDWIWVIKYRKCNPKSLIWHILNISWPKSEFKKKKNCLIGSKKKLGLF